MSTPLVEPEWALVTIMFVDIRGFTTFADRSTAREAVAFLNEFFALIVPILQRHGGHANQLLGDGLLGVFGAPDRLENHADCALECGREMLEAVDAQFGERCRIGIGINSGLVIAGTIGGGGFDDRFSVIGDPVNVAARVESATKELGQPLLLTEATRCMLERPDTALQAHGSLQLRGKAEPVVIYGIAG